MSKRVSWAGFFVLMGLVWWATSEWNALKARVDFAETVAVSCERETASLASRVSELESRR